MPASDRDGCVVMPTADVDVADADRRDGRQVQAGRSIAVDRATLQPTRRHQVAWGQRAGRAGERVP